MYKEYSLQVAALATLVFSLSGCGPADDGLPRTVEASGVVTLDGEPVETASIAFFDAAGQYYATGISDSNGRFSLNSFEAKTGAVPGTYQVKVSKTIEVDLDKDPKLAAKLQEESEHAAESGSGGVHWINDLPKKYANPTTSGIEITIPEDGTDDIRLELTSK